MDKAVIKNFAIWARRRLIEEVSLNAVNYGVDKEEIIEEVAYTWFNRFVALYYMEVNGYLNVGASFFLNERAEFAPGVLEAPSDANISGISKDVVKKLEEKGDREELYRYMIISQCNALGEVLPEIFKKINGYTEFLCPANLLGEDSVIWAMVNDIDVEDWKENVEIISWLYQFYNTEPKNNAFAMLKNNQKLTKERIPEATQLFTPEWIVGYMVDNSLGRFWMEHKADTSLKVVMPYFMEEPSGLEFKYDARLRPEDIRFIDPCMGSGHILDYAFELFLKIYRQRGYSTEHAVRNILKYNLYGLDIDERACQLAYFSIMMKACRYDKTLLNESIRPKFYAVSDSSFLDEELINFVAGDNADYREILESLKEDFKNACELGSIINIAKLNYEALIKHVSQMDTDYYEDLFSMMKYQQVQTKLLPLLKQAVILSGKYNIVATNPPYMSISNMDKILADYVKKEYKDSKKDMYAVFIERCNEFLEKDGYVALITQHTWMFINSYMKLRKKLFSDYHFLHMLHLGTRAFEEISGEVVQTATWVMRQKTERELTEEMAKTSYFMDLTGLSGRDEKETAFFKANNAPCEYVYETDVDSIRKIPGMPLAYWVDKEFAAVYERLPLESYAEATNGLFTCDNKKYLRQWYEVDYTTIKFDCESKEDCIHSGAKWFPYNKGGGFRRWYGNQDYVVYFENFGEEIASFREERGQSRSFPGAYYYFRPSISWSLVSPTKFSVRYYPKGFVFDIAGSSVFVKQESHEMPMLGILASDTIHTMMKISNPTINFQCGDVRALPFEPSLLDNKELVALVEENVALEKEDWDSFELSWNFARHPLAKACGLRQAFEEWTAVTKGRFDRVRDNEAKVSAIVAGGYGLSDELQEYPESEVSMYVADVKAEAKSFISYAVGIMLGRYSLDMPGIAHAGGVRDANNYISYKPLDYVVMDKAVDELVKICELISGAENTEDNLVFLADAISKDDVSDVETAKAVLRNYFKGDFIKDHVKKYKKAPIYWMLQSAKKQVQVLTYMHNFTGNVLESIVKDVVLNLEEVYAEAAYKDKKKEASYKEILDIKENMLKHLEGDMSLDERLSAYENMCKWADILYVN